MNASSQATQEAEKGGPWIQVSLGKMAVIPAIERNVKQKDCSLGHPGQKAISYLQNNQSNRVRGIDQD
jgi:hypothetical protein